MLQQRFARGDAAMDDGEHDDRGDDQCDAADHDRTSSGVTRRGSTSPDRHEYPAA